eukprot:m.118837 g.118837  ORF g.118837 m.118837 type:complete len:298 (+) comp17224_c0_seq1:156-1049(+)
MAFSTYCVLGLVVAVARGAEPGKTVEIAPGVIMPTINLGTCCGSDPGVGLAPWLAAGGVGIDTAFDYKDQTVIADVLAKSTVSRKDLFITTKIPAGFGPLPTDCSADPNISLGYVIENLKELNTTYADLVLLHHPCKTDEINIALWKGLEQALDMGLTKAIGISNYNVDDIKGLLNAGVKVKPAVNQCEWGVGIPDGNRQTGNTTRVFCIEQGITYETFHSMKGCPFDNTQVQSIAKGHNVEVSQVCLRYVLQRDSILAVGTGSNATTAGEYAKENLDIYDFNLSDAEMTYLDSLSK